MRQLAIAEGLTSYMNNTKWRGVFAMFGSWSDPPPRFRVFDRLAGPEPSEWMRQWQGYPRPFVSLQWIEVELPSTDVPRALAQCRARNVPADATEYGVQIYGWMGGSRPLA
jgi:hypothetical protein